MLHGLLLQEGADGLLNVFGPELGPCLLSALDVFPAASPRALAHRDEHDGPAADESDSDDEIDLAALRISAPEETALTAKLRAALKAVERIKAEHKPPPTLPRCLAMGQRVLIANIKARPELNGVNAQVVGPAKDGRYDVRIVKTGSLWGGYETLSLKAECLLQTLEDQNKASAPPAKSKAIDLVGLNEQMIDAIEPALRHVGSSSFRRPGRVLRLLTLEALAVRGTGRCMAAMLRRTEGTAQKVEDLVALAVDAVLFCYYRDRPIWKCPDALFFIGVAQLARVNLSEAVYYLSACLRAKAERWTLGSNRAFAETLLLQARRERPPRFGQWRPVVSKVGETQAPQQSCGPAYCDVGGTLYIFGGLGDGGKQGAMLLPMLLILDDNAGTKRNEKPRHTPRLRRFKKGVALRQTRKRPDAAGARLRPAGAFPRQALALRRPPDVVRLARRLRAPRRHVDL
mmetsp:Transcript_28276/g.97751  ORF Transcript_28276/g.97751 Transcript_28276/m.97751 type:complete len:458 (-) Transcript_28276:123-1496(-)